MSGGHRWWQRLSALRDVRWGMRRQDTAPYSYGLGPAGAGRPCLHLLAERRIGSVLQSSALSAPSASAPPGGEFPPCVRTGGANRPTADCSSASGRARRKPWVVGRAPTHPRSHRPYGSPGPRASEPLCLAGRRSAAGGASRCPPHNRVPVSSDGPAGPPRFGIMAGRD
jgi:hypothetical protein